MKRLLLPLLFLGMVGLAAGCQTNEKPLLRETNQSPYVPGQIMNFSTRPGEETAFLVVTKVEESVIGDDTTVIVHVYIDGIHIEHPDGGVIEIVPHMPFTEAALNRSGVFPIDLSLDLPDYESGYEKWRDAYLKGEADVFEVPVRVALDNLEWSIQSQTEE